MCSFTIRRLLSRHLRPAVVVVVVVAARTTSPSMPALANPALDDLVVGRQPMHPARQASPIRPSSACRYASCFLAIAPASAESCTHYLPPLTVPQSVPPRRRRCSAMGVTFTCHCSTMLQHSQTPGPASIGLAAVPWLACFTIQRLSEGICCITTCAVSIACC
jgi:hypothetical protein